MAVWYLLDQIKTYWVIIFYDQTATVLIRVFIRVFLPFFLLVTSK